MTEQSNAELIAEAQEVSASEHEELGEGAYVGGLLDRLAAALEAADQRAENAERQHRLSQKAWAETLSDRNQYAAVVEKVRGFCADLHSGTCQDVLDILATAPADALREHDGALIEKLATEAGYSLVHHEEAVAFLRREARQRREERA